MLILIDFFVFTFLFFQVEEKTNKKSREALNNKLRCQSQISKFREEKKHISEARSKSETRFVDGSKISTLVNLKESKAFNTRGNFISLAFFFKKIYLKKVAVFVSVLKFTNLVRSFFFYYLAINRK